MNGLDYASSWFGSIDQHGRTIGPGSQTWTAEIRGPGLVKVTIRGHADHQPSVLLTVMSNDLQNASTGPNAGSKKWITVSDMGKDSSGNWFFGVNIRNEAGPKASAFSFLALATTTNQR